MKSSKEVIGTMIKSRRKERDFTQKQLADLLEVDRQYVWRLENGKVNFTMDYLDKVIFKLNCDQKDFIVIPIEI
ncbi:helix-turn-helix domain-containing protein [Daejeonella rubra]|nr:helix-turn-helix transcriptional regulator [Daejeonella rubra]